MPDGLTHMLAAYPGGRRYLSGFGLALFLLGSLLPDLLIRGGRLLFSAPSLYDWAELYLVPLHTPVGALLTCVALAQLFHESVRKSAFLCLYGGCWSHFVLDFFQRAIEGFGFTRLKVPSYSWLYPFSGADFQLGLFWAEDAPWALLVLVPLSLRIWYGGRKRVHPRTRPSRITELQDR